VHAFEVDLTDRLIRALLGVGDGLAVSGNFVEEMIAEADENAAKAKWCIR